MNELKLPFYARATVILLGLALLVLTIHLARDIIFPLYFAAIFAILLLPVEQRLRGWGVPRLLAITLTVLLGFALLLALLYFVYAQAGQLSAELPLFKQKLVTAVKSLEHWLTATYGISSQRMLGWLNEAGSRAGTWAGQSLTAVSGLVVVLTLLPVYIFLLLFYKPLLVEFLTRAFSGRRPNAGVAEIMQESKRLVESYMLGLLMEGGIVAVLNTGVLLLIGIPYALLLGVLGALLNFIPYVGGLVAVALPVLIAFVTKDGWGYPLAVTGGYLLIQFVDNHLLIPRIVASKVKVNALVAIVGVLIGNAIGGVAGMFLALPTIAILKIIFDRIEGLQPWGLLLGDQLPPSGPSLGAAASPNPDPHQP